MRAAGAAGAAEPALLPPCLTLELGEAGLAPAPIPKGWPGGEGSEGEREGNQNLQKGSCPRER